MGQEIKIPVSADTSKAEAGIEGLANAFDKVGVSAKRMGAGVKSAADQVRELAAAKEYARKMLGRDVSDADAARVADNFSGARRAGPYAKTFRTFSDLGGWDQGVNSLYKTRGEAERARAHGNARLFEGTSFAGAGGPPPRGGGEEGGGGSEAAAGVRRIQQQALGFGKSMLALAGITSVLAMAGKAKELATEEAVGTDTLKRRLGDLGVSFENLRDQARSAGQGLGVTYVESMRLGSAYSKEVGNIGATDLKGQGFSHMMRGQFGFARAYGVDTAESTQFFGQMARYGVGRDEQAQRKLAMLIGDSVAKSGYGGQVEQLMHAVADYTSLSARMTLSTPNVGAYANAITSMIGSRPGLDTAGSAAILGMADSAVRNGGAYGDASKNAFYAALRNASPGMRPVDALAVMQGGLFGTTNQVFGKGGSLEGWGGKGVHPDDVTNADKMIPMLLRQYGHNTMGLRAIQNAFGLNSMGQARSLADMRDKGLLGGTERLLASAHIEAGGVSADGLATLGQLGAAKSHGDLMKVYDSVAARKDLTPAQRAALAKAVKDAGGDDEALRRGLATQVAGLSQEKTPGTEVRDSIANLTDLLTSAGGPVMSVLNVIRDAVVSIAELVPGSTYMDTTGSRAEGDGVGKGGGGAARRRGSAVQGKIEQDAMTFYMTKGWSHDQAAAIVARDLAESGEDPHALGDNGKAQGVAQWHSDRWRKFKKWAADNGVTNLRDFGAQWGFRSYEMTDGDEKQSGYMLKHARNSRERSVALLANERPGGWKYWGQSHPENVNGWKDQVAIQHRLEGSVDVTLTMPNGAKKTVKAPMIARPKAAGVAANASPALDVSDPAGLAATLK